MVSAKPTAGPSPTRPAGMLLSPIWIRPRRKVPVVMTTAPATHLPPVTEPDTRHRAILDEQISDLAFDDRESGCSSSSSWTAAL